MSTIYDFSALSISGQPRNLSDFDGNVVLVVNVASECGLTPQYDGLQKLHDAYAGKGLVICGFPCNQFGAQEQGSNSEIAEFCTTHFGVDFPMFAKIEVNGDNADPLYKWLKQETPGSNDEPIGWNFAKFLIGRDGKPIARFAPDVIPEDLTADIERALDR